MKCCTAIGGKGLMTCQFSWVVAAFQLTHGGSDGVPLVGVGPGGREREGSSCHDLFIAVLCLTLLSMKEISISCQAWAKLQYPTWYAKLVDYQAGSCAWNCKRLQAFCFVGLGSPCS